MKSKSTEKKIPTYEELLDLFAQTRETIEKNAIESKQKFIEAEKRAKEMDKYLKYLGKEIGKVHRERGTYTEYILMPSIEDIVINQFKLDSFDANVSRRIKDEEIQIDAIGFTNSTRNEVLVVEVKTKLDKEDIEQIEKHLKRLDYFFPEHKNKKKYGMLAAISASKELIAKVHKKGLYFAKIKDDILKLDSPKDFVPKEY